MFDNLFAFCGSGKISNNMITMDGKNLGYCKGHWFQNEGKLNKEKVELFFVK